MTKAVYGGSFDPFTNGHLNIVERASKLFDTVMIAVSENPNKSYLFSHDERICLIKEAVIGIPNVDVIKHEEGLLVSFAKEKEAQVLIRGIRNGLDIDLEEMMAEMNHHQEPAMETLFLMAKATNRFISSTLVKEVAELGGDVRELVPEGVFGALKKIDWNSDRKEG